MNLKNVFTRATLFVFVFQIVMFSPTVFAQTDVITHVESTETKEVTERIPIPTFETDLQTEVIDLTKVEIKEELVDEPEIIAPIRRSGGGGTVIIKEKEPEIPIYYIGLMRRVRDLKTLDERQFENEKKSLLNDLQIFVDQEKKKMETLKIDRDKQGEYFKLLDTQLAYVKESTYYGLQKEIKEDLSKPVEVDVLKNPSQFKFADDDVKIKSIDLGLEDIEIKRKTAINLLFDLFNPFEVQNAIAVAPAYLPIIEEVNEDAEAVISYEIKELARELNNNPVEIVNYIQNNITYEPYFGAKKGSSGCLREKVCNDVDTTSLTVALMRAAGIPARYKKGIAVMTVEQLQDLLGVDETRTVYFALGANKVPVFTVSGNTLNQDIDLADFSGETHLGVEWVHPEIFYNYDEQGANIANLENLNGIDNTTDLQALYEGKIKKHWIPVDAITREYDRTQNEIVHDTASFDTETFWYDFFQYQGDLSPVGKYTQDLLVQTGKDINQEQYQSTRDLHERQFDILPPTLPYQFASGVDEGGTAIDIETWSQLPDIRRFKVNVSVLRQSDSSEVISADFYGSEINNVPMDLMYEGATEADEAIIASYGGIHMTPASLVNIKPYFVTDYGRDEASSDVEIGESLILQFEYYVNGDSIYSDQKFSVAGNSEGIYMVLSKVVDDDRLNDGVDDESEILIGGNARIAWKYIREIEENAALLEKALDYEYNNHVLRTVITQNRILAEVGGVPTTFDFKGLTMDASAYINDYSRRGNFHIHEGDYRLLWGEQASYDEAQVIEDLTGVNSISTVQGLQYAYANPQDYTIHIIDTGNESVIDTLSLSANTKQNMHDDVQDGNTIVTSDQPVTQGSFTGVLYISLDPEKTGTYAIGEQNGAWQVAFLDLETYIDELNFVGTAYKAISDDIYYLYEDKYFGTGTYEEGEKSYYFHCNIENSKAIDTMNEPGYQVAYGYPCFVPDNSYEYGDYLVSFKVATGATKFWKGGSSGHTYWHYNNDILNRLANHLGYGSPYRAKFNIDFGTYSKVINPGTTERFYMPVNNGGTNGAIYQVHGNNWKTLYQASYTTGQYLCGQDSVQCGKSAVYHYLGYPTGEANLSESYQDFIGGRIYYTTNLSGEWSTSYYVPGKINGHHENNGGVGVYGFPIENPVFISADQVLVQNFEKGRIELRNEVSSDGQIIQTIYSQHVTNQDSAYWEGFYDQFTEEELFGIVINITSGVALVATFKRFVKKLMMSPSFISRGFVKFIPLIGWGFMLYSVLVTSQDITHLDTACNSNVPIDGLADVNYYCGKRDAVMVLSGLGVLGELAAESRLAKNIFYTGEEAAKVAKYKLFELMDDVAQLDSLSNVSYSHKLSRIEFYNNLGPLVDNADDISLKLLLDDGDLMWRMADDAVDFYNKFDIQDIYDGSTANTYFSGYDSPVPFTPGTNVLDLHVTNSLFSDEFVRFHAQGNANRPFIMKRADIPYKANGQIDLNKLREDFNINDLGGVYPIDRISKYKPHAGDIIVEGHIHGGDNNLMQYAIRQPGYVPVDRFQIDTQLTSLLP